LGAAAAWERLKIKKMHFKNSNSKKKGLNIILRQIIFRKIKAPNGVADRDLFCPFFEPVDGTIWSNLGQFADHLWQ